MKRTTECIRKRPRPVRAPVCLSCVPANPPVTLARLSLRTIVVRPAPRSKKPKGPALQIPSECLSKKGLNAHLQTAHSKKQQGALFDI